MAGFPNVSFKYYLNLKCHNKREQLNPNKFEKKTPRKRDKQPTQDFR